VDGKDGAYMYVCMYVSLHGTQRKKLKFINSAESELLDATEQHDGT
jgi:hypothetical protein